MSFSHKKGRTSFGLVQRLMLSRERRITNKLGYDNLNIIFLKKRRLGVRERGYMGIRI